MHIFENYSHEYKTRRIFELWIKSCSEDLWIGDGGASSHMMGSEEHVFNKKLIFGSMRTVNGAHMKMLCEGDINVDLITKNGDVTSGTLRVKVIPGMKQKLFSFTQAMLGG